jgi:hypothetical protein
MIALYFPELSLELFERAETFAVLITFSQIDNAPGFWLPSDDLDGNTVVVFEPSVEFTHNAFALR